MTDMSDEIKRLTEELFDRACYEAASAGYIGEEVLTAGMNMSIRAVRLLSSRQRRQYFQEIGE
jgi:hypothetical protein